MLKERMAIACRNQIELRALLNLCYKQGFNWYNKNAEPDLSEFHQVRIYICPLGYSGRKNAELAYSNDEYVDDIEEDEDDSIDWIYLEAGELIPNHIKAEELKNAT